MDPRWIKIQDFTAQNKDLLILVAMPETDEILVSYNLKNAFVKFPMERKHAGVVFNVLKKSNFDKAIDPFMNGVIKAVGLDESDKDANQLYNVLGGSMKSIGDEHKGSKLEVFNKKKNGKSKKK